MLEKTPNWDRLDVAIEHVGRAITLPAEPGKMPPEKAIEALQRKIADENQEFNVHEIIDAYPLDAAVAFVKAMAKLYGWASPQSTPGFFGSRPPHMVSVKIGHRDEDVVQCPLGTFQLPGVDSKINTTFDTDSKGRPVFVIYSKIKKKDKHLLLELANETRRIVKEESIYRGKAVRLGVDHDGNLDMSEPPSFLDVSSQDELIFDADIEAQIQTSIFVPIMHTAVCRKLKIPLKRGVLFHGRYGTGKTMAARKTAKVCEENGWTFILLDKVQGLRAALEFANRYAPAVVFAEDIDRIMGERDERANDLCNTIDGVVSKNSQIMTILTTNHVDKIAEVMLRPGRLDDIIELRPPSDEAVKRLLRVYAGKLLAADADVDGAARELSGQIPASIRECVERAKLGMVGRGDNHLIDSDLVVAAQTMKNHLALLNRDSKQQTAAEKLAESLHEVVGNGSTDMLNQIQRTVRDIHNQVC